MNLDNNFFWENDRKSEEEKNGKLLTAQKRIEPIFFQDLQAESKSKENSGEFSTPRFIKRSISKVYSKMDSRISEAKEEEEEEKKPVQFKYVIVQDVKDSSNYYK